jgi:hypothetical protein
MQSVAAASPSHLRIGVGIAFLGEQLTWARAAGMVLIGGGAVAMTATSAPAGAAAATKS